MTDQGENVNAESVKMFLESEQEVIIYMVVSNLFPYFMLNKKEESAFIKFHIGLQHKCFQDNKNRIN